MSEDSKQTPNRGFDYYITNIIKFLIDSDLDDLINVEITIPKKSDFSNDENSNDEYDKAVNQEIKRIVRSSVKNHVKNILYFYNQGKYSTVDKTLNDIENLWGCTIPYCSPQLHFFGKSILSST